MNLLAISLDRSLVAKGISLGDNPWRQQQYARTLDRVWHVVYTRRGDAAQAARVGDNLIAYPTQSASRWRFPLDAYRIGKGIVASARVDLVTAQDPFGTGIAAYWLKRRFAIPLCVQIFSSFFDNPAWLASGAEARLLHPLGKFVVRRADTVRVQSAAERDRVLSLGVPANRIWVIPLLIDLERFRRADGAAIHTRYPGRRLILYAGRLAREKNLALLVHAAARAARAHPDMLLLIAGDGPERSRLEALARSVDPAAVEFTGAVAHADLAPYFAASELVVLTSLYEGVPTVLVEAAASARPVVSTPQRSLADVLVPGQTGLVAEASPESVAAQITFLLGHPEEARAMGARGRAFVTQRYDPQRVLGDLRRMWDATARAPAP